MSPCGHSPCFHFETSGAGETGRHWFFPVPGPSGEALFVLGFHLLGASSMAELSEPLFKRLLCQVLLQHLPDEGLDEAYQSLLDMNEFYRLPRYVPPPPLPRQSIPVRMGPGHVRPVFPVTEEE